MLRGSSAISHIAKANESLDSLRYALRAVWKESVQFSFYYPLEIVLEAGHKHSLQYYLYSNSLSWDAMRMDASGIPKTWYRVTGAVYWPAYIAWYGIVNLEHYVRSGNQEKLDIFLKQVGWLERNAAFRSNDSVVWPMNFDYPVGPTLLKAPWVSAHAQGLAISALVRAWRITRRPSLMEILEKSTKIFQQRVSEGGIRVELDGNVLYTEVPGGPAPGILDGFMTSLLGLYDLYVETQNPSVGRLFEQGVEGLKNSLPRWDYRRKWSWYGSRGYLSPPAYHCLNRLLLSVLARLTSEPRFAEYAQRWNPQNLSAVERLEIYVSFLITKNLCRLRHRTWQHKNFS